MLYTVTVANTEPRVLLRALGVAGTAWPTVGCEDSGKVETGARAEVACGQGTFADIVRPGLLKLLQRLGERCAFVTVDGRAYLLLHADGDVTWI